MTFSRRGAVWIIFAGFLILVCAGLLCLPVYSFLAMNQRPPSADVLVVEGWLNENTLEKAKEEFRKNHYNLIITTGFPYVDGYRMGSGGVALFDLQNQVKPVTDSLYTVTLLCRGTGMDKIFAHVRLYADTMYLGDLYTTHRKKEHSFRVKLASPPDFIKLSFDNDNYSNREDRDLYLYVVRVNEISLEAGSSRVALYDSDRYGRDSLIRILGSSTAAIAANYLVLSGIPDSLVVPVETRDKGISKTYRSALDVRQKLEECRPRGIQSITVFSEGVHARRSYVSFRKAFGDLAAIGVISVSDKTITPSGWRRSAKGWTTILYEIAGLLYVKYLC